MKKVYRLNTYWDEYEVGVEVCRAEHGTSAVILTITAKDNEEQWSTSCNSYFVTRKDVQYGCWMTLVTK